jgi:hypothetical protein
MLVASQKPNSALRRFAHDHGREGLQLLVLLGCVAVVLAAWAYVWNFLGSAAPSAEYTPQATAGATATPTPTPVAVRTPTPTPRPTSTKTRPYIPMPVLPDPSDDEDGEDEATGEVTEPAGEVPTDEPAVCDPATEICPEPEATTEAPAPEETAVTETTPPTEFGEGGAETGPETTTEDGGTPPS